jgi:hypothetical protein
MQTLITRSAAWALAACALLIGSAHATITSGFGVVASASTFGNCPSYCTGFAFASSGDGGEGLLSAQASESTYGTARAQVFFNAATDYLPQALVYGSSDEGRLAAGAAFAAQGFSFTDPVARTLSLTVNLEATLTPGQSGYQFNYAQADIAIFKTSALGWYPSFGTLAFEVGADSLVTYDYLFITAPGFHQTSTTLSVDLNPGDDFYVVVELIGHGQNGTTDAWGTLSAQFDDPSGIVAAAIPVPEPTTPALWLLGSVGLLAGAVRRRATANRRS